MASSSASDTMQIWQDDFSSPRNEEKKTKRSGWHKRKSAPSPTAAADLEQPENPKKKTKPDSEQVVKIAPAPAAAKKERDKDADDAEMTFLGLNPLVHVPRCENCGAENSFQENDEAAMVCTKCAHVGSKPELQRGWDMPFNIDTNYEDRRAAKEVHRV